MIGVLLAAALAVTSPPLRHPGLEPGSRFLHAAEQAAGPRVKPGVTDRGTDVSRAAAVDAVVRRYGMAGEVLVARGDRVLLDRGYGPIRPDGGPLHEAGERWRLASITKQVTAALVVKAIVAEGTLADLDKPIDQAAGAAPGDIGSFGKLTTRQLLSHHTGLANPDATAPGTDGVPAFYTRIGDPSYCVSQPARPGAPFSYNNCDYIMIGGGLASAGWPAGMSMAKADEVGVPGFVGSKPEPKFHLASWGAAGGLIGTARAVFDFDRSLITGKLLPPAIRDGELWKPEGNGSYQALGAWVFPGRLAGCAQPKRIVQRDGEIWGVQARNFILPDDDLAVVVFTNRSADDFAIGEVWEGKGFVYDLLSAAVGC